MANKRFILIFSFVLLLVFSTFFSLFNLDLDAKDVKCIRYTSIREPICDVRYDFHIKTMSGSSLPPAVCRRAHVLFMLFVFVWPVFTSSSL